MTRLARISHTFPAATPYSTARPERIGETSPCSVFTRLHRRSDDSPSPDSALRRFPPQSGQAATKKYEICGLATTFLLVSLAFLLAGCKTLQVITNVGAAAAAATGVVTPQQAQSAARVVTAGAKTFESITPEQEYYIGRAVAATVLKTYKPADNKRATRYINILGQTLAAASDKPETFGGYHFLIMDTDEVNAFAAPGGLIFVSRGLLRCCASEDAVAAVLAHEIGHVQLAHGLRAIKKSRLTSALTTLAAESAKTLGGEQLAELTTAFEGTIGDITATMINSGYARKYETQADKVAIDIMTRVGYNPFALKRMLLEMDKNMDANAGGFAKTHPDPKVRIEDIQALLKEHAESPAPAPRQERFQKALSEI